MYIYIYIQYIIIYIHGIYLSMYMVASKHGDPSRHPVVMDEHDLAGLRQLGETLPNR